MPDISAIGAALAALKAAKDIAVTMIDLRDAAAFQNKMIEFQSRILDAQNATFAALEERTALLEEVSALKKQVAAFEEWEREKQRYELKQATEYCEALVYRIKQSAQGTEPLHDICPTCFDEGKKIYSSERSSAARRGYRLGLP